MFNNFINHYDLYSFLNKGFEIFLIVVRKIFKGKKKRTEDAWEFTEYPNDNWWDIPEVLERWNLLISGEKDVDHYNYISKKYFPDRKDIIGFSIGCGTGDKELKWIEQGIFSNVDAIDISEPRIKKATEKANSKGYEKIIKYEVRDIYKAELKSDYYDMIFVEQALHHFSPLKILLLQINDSLKPGGYFVVNEFVGPTRFQWTKRQNEIINSLLDLLPTKYKIKLDGKTIKENVYSPSKLRMLLLDPSEAVESSNIVPFLYEIFDVVEFKEYGGTILHSLFNQIAHNFNSDNIETKRWIKTFFEVEDLLLAEKEIKSDFVVAVCKKKVK